MNGKPRVGRRLALLATAAFTALGVALVPALTASASVRSVAHSQLPVPPGAIKHIMVIELENESEGETFGASSPATYLNDTLLPEGELIQNYYAVGHVSLDNYIAQVSGQAPNQMTSSDCVTSLTSLDGSYNDVTPGALDPDQARYPGQVDGQGCVFPASVETIGNQLDRAYPRTIGSDWREYAEDMGNDPGRDGGQPDPLGGTDCAHPTQVNGVASDDTNNAEGPNATGTQVKSTTIDQYADRHNPFIYFHSVTDNQRLCDHDVVPLGTATTESDGTVTYHGHLSLDLAHSSTTPRFAFITPNLCDDGHDATCAGFNDAGGTTGGLVGADDFLKTWMPLILNSPAYRSGSMLVMITFDEGGTTDTTAGDNEQPGPNSANPGYSPLLNTPIAAYGGLTYYDLLGITSLTPGQEPPAGTMPGGGEVGAVLLNPDWIKAGTVDTTGSYNHYSALRTFEDLLGMRTGGADGHGHLGFAATATDFGPDVFNAHPRGRF
ncbi:MAG TPA: alkaline phosphatase family protein [Streptosporangiaceae bacterium]|nr:alkaline phosphatase family protein [Streptosporangiaceae bacterium]